MASEIGGVDDLSGFVSWALDNSIWDGRRVDWTEAPDLLKSVKERIALYVLTDPLGRTAAQFAWIGSQDRASIAEEMREIVDGRIVQAGAAKSIGKFWQKHKTEILVGAGILAGLTTLAIIAACSATAAAGAAALGGGAINAANDALAGKQPEHKKREPRQDTENQETLEKQLVFGEKGILIGGQYASYDDLLQTPQALLLGDAAKTNSALHQASWVGNYFEDAGKEIGVRELSKRPESAAALLPQPFPNASPQARIGGINGINTTAEQAGSHRDYLASFFPNQTVDWVYNKTHGAAVDLLEVFGLNYGGLSPNTARDLRANWAAFHRENRERPNAKYLQFCHSQGAIHVRNALIGAPQEIRDRVIVVAIAPGAVVPRKLCYKSFNYASKKDLIPYGELGYAGALNTNEYNSSKWMEIGLEHRQELILLDPHPNVSGIDHDFQSPTFKKIIAQQLEDHIHCGGEYK